MVIPLNVELQRKADFIFNEPDAQAGGFAWMHGKSTYRVWPELRGKNYYWYMRKMIDGERFNIYVAPAGRLSAELLNNAAAQIAATASPVKPKGAS